MNLIFTGIILLSAAVMCIYNPADFLPAMLSGASNAAKCALTLFCIYAVWMGLSCVAEECRITDKVSRLLAPACKRLFKTQDNNAVKNLSMNISCNLLGIGGAATPYAIKAIDALEKEQNTYAQNLLFIINATSIQLIPATVIALRAANGSAAAYDIVIPSLIATAISTGAAVLIFIFIEKLARRKKSK